MTDPVNTSETLVREYEILQRFKSEEEARIIYMQLGYLSNRLAALKKLQQIQDKEEFERQLKKYLEIAQKSFEKFCKSVPNLIHEFSERGCFAAATLQTIALDDKKRYFVNIEINGSAEDTSVFRFHRACYDSYGRKTNLSHLNLTNATIRSGVNFDQCNIRKAIFRGATFLQTLDLSNADARQLDLRNAAISNFITSYNTQFKKTRYTDKKEFVDITVWEHEFSNHCKIIIKNDEIDLNGVSYSFENFEKAFATYYKNAGFGFGNQLDAIKKFPKPKQRIQALLFHNLHDPNSRTARAIKMMMLSDAQKDFNPDFLGQFRLRYQKGDQLSVVDQNALFLHAMKDPKSRTFGILFDMIPKKEVREDIPPLPRLQSFREDEKPRAVLEHNERSISLGSLTGIGALFSASMQRSTFGDEAKKTFLQDHLKKLSVFSDADKAEKIAKYYLELKAKSVKLDEVDQLLSNFIYPQYLRYYLKPNGHDFVFVSHIISIFKRAGVSDEIKKFFDAIFTPSSTPTQVSVKISSKEKNALFNKKWAQLSLKMIADSDADDNAKKYLTAVNENMKSHGELAEPRRTILEKQYYLLLLENEEDQRIEFRALNEIEETFALLPLAFLQKMNRVEKEIAEKVSKKMQQHTAAEEPDRTRIEKQYYIAELMIQGKYEDAKREAEGLRCAWPDFNFQDDPHEVFKNSFELIKDKIVSTVVKQKTADKQQESFEADVKAVQEVYASLISPLKFNIVEAQILFNNCSFDNDAFLAPIRNGIEITDCIKCIIENWTRYSQITEADLAKLISYKDKLFFWIGAPQERHNEKKKFGNRTDNFSVILKSFLEHDVKQKNKISSTALKSIKLALLGSEELLLSIEDVLSPIYRYRPIENALAENNRNAVLKRRLDRNADHNKNKYDEAVKIREAFQKLETDIVSVVANSQDELLPIEKFDGNVFDALLSRLADSMKKIEAVNSKAFLGLLEGAHYNLTELQRNWQEKLRERVVVKINASSSPQPEYSRYRLHSPYASPRGGATPTPRSPIPTAFVSTFGMR